MQLVKAFIKDATFGIALLLIATALCLAYVSLPFFGNKSLIVRSGSMNPTINTGDLVVVTAQNAQNENLALKTPKYKLGEIIAFKDIENSKTLVTHRIVGIESANGQILYRTKGDANNSPDKILVPQQNVLGPAIFSVGEIGKIFAFAKSKVGLATFVVFPALIVIAIEIFNISKVLKKKKPFLVTYVKAASTLKILLAIVLTAFLAKFTYAYFSDTATSINNTFAAAISFPSPSPSPTAGAVVINEINWGGSNGDGNDEWVELKNTTSNPINIGNWIVENLGTGSGPGANITIPSGNIIPANGFFIISQQNKASSKMNVDPDYITISVNLNNGGEQLVLKSSSPITIDTANGTGAWFFGSNSTPKKSMERKSPPGDGTLSTNWQTATTHTNMDASGATDEFGTPKAENGV